MPRRLTRVLIPLLILVLTGLICGSAVSVKFAFGLSRITGTPLWCRLLVLPQFGSDYAVLAAEVRPYCIGAVVGRIGRLDDCLAIQLPNEETTQTARHACIDTLAGRLHEPELCEAIEYPDSNWLSDYNEEYQDRCRAWSISKLEECQTGFITTGWAEGVAERCHSYLAVNLQDASLCDALQDETQRTSCHEAVERPDSHGFGFGW